MNSDVCQARAIALFLLLLTFISGCGLRGRPVTVTISEIGTCTDFDRTSKEPTGRTDEFPPDTNQLMVYFYAKTNLEAEVTYRWFFENDLIAQYALPLDQGYNFSWINAEDTFPEGEYKVEILLGQSTLRSTSFRVISP